MAATIEAIKLEEIGKDKQTKPVLYFQETGTGFICNKTNGRTIARLVGSEEFDDWIGRTIRLYRTEVDFQGEMVEAIRVRSRPDKVVTKAASKQKKAAPAPDDEVELDENGTPY